MGGKVSLVDTHTNTENPVSFVISTVIKNNIFIFFDYKHVSLLELLKNISIFFLVINPLYANNCM